MFLYRKKPSPPRGVGQWSVYKDRGLLTQGLLLTCWRHIAVLPRRPLGSSTWPQTQADLFPLHKWENGGPETLRDSPIIMELVNSKLALTSVCPIPKWCSPALWCQVRQQGLHHKVTVSSSVKSCLLDSAFTKQNHPSPPQVVGQEEASWGTCLQESIFSFGGTSSPDLGGGASQIFEAPLLPHPSLLGTALPWELEALPRGTGGSGPRWGTALLAPRPAGLFSSRLCNLALNRSRCVVWCQGDQTWFLRVTAPLWNPGRWGSTAVRSGRWPWAGRSELVAWGEGPVVRLDGRAGTRTKLFLRGRHQATHSLPPEPLPSSTPHSCQALFALVQT